VRLLATVGSVVSESSTHTRSEATARTDQNGWQRKQEGQIEVEKSVHKVEGGRLYAIKCAPTVVSGLEHIVPACVRVFVCVCLLVCWFVGLLVVRWFVCVCLCWCVRVLRKRHRCKPSARADACRWIPQLEWEKEVVQHKKSRNHHRRTHTPHGKRYTQHDVREREHYLAVVVRVNQNGWDLASSEHSGNSEHSVNREKN
jgi:hypothetical protein